MLKISLTNNQHSNKSTINMYEIGWKVIICIYANTFVRLNITLMIKISLMKLTLIIQLRTYLNIKFLEIKAAMKQFVIYQICLNLMFMYIISTLLWHIYIYGYKCHFLFVWMLTLRLIEQLYFNNTLGKDDNIFRGEAQQIR